MAFESINEKKWETVFKWTLTQQQAFEHLKHKLCTTPVLALPDLHQPFEIEMDATDYALRVVITPSYYPYAFHYEAVNGTVKRYSTYEKELYSIVQAIKQWRH